MGDEQHGFLVAFPDAEQHFPHQRAGPIIQRTERLVEQILGSLARAGALAVRCCMPPESCFGQGFSKPDQPTRWMNPSARGREGLAAAADNS